MQTLNASTPSTLYQQLLFHHTFENATGDHSVSILVHMADGKTEFDLDYVTYTSVLRYVASSINIPFFPILCEPNLN